MAPQKNIELHGVRVHNLKNISVTIPKNKLVVITGVSGSGKSSLMIDTLYAEGQRRYVESLNSYARQFLSRMNKPDLDYIKGICPAIAIEQKVVTGNNRSTVGSMTELYDYLRLLFSNVGITYSPISGQVVKQHTVTDVVIAIKNLPVDSRVYLVLELIPKHNRTLAEELKVLIQKGFARVLVGDNTHRMEELVENKTLLKSIEKDKKNKKYVIIDRLVVPSVVEDEHTNRWSDSVLTAFNEGEGACVLICNNIATIYNNRFECDGMAFERPTPNFFNFNNPYGACSTCEGFGSIIGIDPNLVIPDKEMSVFEGGVGCWKGEKMDEWRIDFINKSAVLNFPIHRSISKLNEAEYNLLWEGNAAKNIHGIHQFFKYVEQNTYKIQYRVMQSRYKGRTVCSDCMGARIRKDARYVMIDGKNIHQLLNTNIWEVQRFFNALNITPQQQALGKRILLEINNRLQFMVDVGLGYLSLNRLSGTLSGGETQRINLTRAIGSNLTGSLYILDEPSIGLHPRDTENLIKVLLRLRDLGNTVTVVEHEESIMRAADHIIDMGPEAGTLGGEVMASAPYNELIKIKKSLTAAYLNGTLSVGIPKNKRPLGDHLLLSNCSKHNLKNITVNIPLNTFTVVSGVSGSGKTTLVKHILTPALKEYFMFKNDAILNKYNLSGDIKKITQVEIIDQEPIGKSTRSNPVTYVKAFDEIRILFAEQKVSKLNFYKPGTFSFNVEGGRCEGCKGEGVQTIAMQFLADVHLLCEECQGARYKKEILDVKYKNKNISEVLQMTLDEAVDFFADQKQIYSKIKPLKDVGLGYVQLGQSSNTLSGGEAQRVKLASFLIKEKSTERIFFIFDEPTTGLHFHDINKLLIALNALVENGHTVLVIEHNLDVIKCADWLIDLGPEGGDGGGNLVFQGTVADAMKANEGYTCHYLNLLNKSNSNAKKKIEKIN